MVKEWEGITVTPNTSRYHINLDHFQFTWCAGWSYFLEQGKCRFGGRPRRCSLFFSTPTEDIFFGGNPTAIDSQCELLLILSPNYCSIYPCEDHSAGCMAGNRFCSQVDFCVFKVNLNVSAKPEIVGR